MRKGDEVAGPFLSLSQAEGWAESPPDLAYAQRPALLVCWIERKPSGWFVVGYEEEAA